MITERGYMGLAPAIAQEGDLCSIIFGCASPSLLRPTAAGSKNTFLGAAFVQGSHSAEYQDYDDGRTEDASPGGGGSSLPPAQSRSPEVDDIQHGREFSNTWCGFSHFGELGYGEWTEWAEEQDIYLV